MTHITDYKRDSMQTVLGSSVTNIDDLEIAYLQSLGATSNHVNNAWMQVFLANGATSANWNNAAEEFLDALGATGDGLPAKWNWFWVTNGGVVGLTTLVYDTFTDSDSTLLTSHTPDVDTVGGGWIAESIETTYNIIVNNNQAEANSGTTNLRRYSIDAGNADVLVTAEGAHTADGQGLVCRISDLNNMWLGYGVIATLYEVNNGAFVSRGTATSGDTSTNAELEANGSVITYRCPNGTLVYNSATFNQTVTSHGMRLDNNSTSQYFDDFTVTAL